MNKAAIVVSFVLCLLWAQPLFASECMEGDCNNGAGTGFVHNKIYEGEWKDGLPHGRGKLFVSRGKVLEGIWEKGKLVQEERAGEKKDDSEKKN